MASSLNLASLVMPTEVLTATQQPPAPSYGTLPPLNPPLFFEIVEDQVYRSNKCDSSSFPFLATLHLNTVVYLSYDDLTRELVDFFKEKEITVIHLGLKYRSSSHWKGISEGMAKEAIEHILDQRRHPIMVMCKTGVHFAGTIIGCLRRLQNWSLTATIDKYRNLASSIKTRFENEQFIELFDVDLVTLPQHLPDWFVHNQTLMEEERIALMKGECYPGLKRDAIIEKKTNDSTNAEDNGPPTPAYQKYYFFLQGPLASPSVKFSEKKSIIGDDDDD
uniref:Tyrosine-protein phosphatase domain-containing protein n=1 Tax=Globisporangium ultimum (strain ATCC 200006 / CBS 805.95 / DAOM BR144) TaxID=431595 RepID=K3W6Q6_GLOUD